MILEFENDKNSHYYYVMAWTDDTMKNGPVSKKKFDIYDDAINFYNRCIHKIGKSGYVRIFEYIGEKRKEIKNSEEDGIVECQGNV